MTEKDATAALREVAGRREEAEREAACLRAETEKLVLAGYAAGVPKSVLAEEAGITRQTVYMILARNGVALTPKTRTAPKGRRAVIGGDLTQV